jgi:HTH-type transcriptional regulator/antitoxin HigA
MIIKSIKTDVEYKEAVQLLEKIGDDSNFENDEKLVEQFNSLFELVKSYEDLNFALEAGHPIEVIKLKMEYMNIKAKDLIPYVGSKGVVSDVLNRKRKLSKAMIRNLSKFLNISQEILNMEYECVIDKTKKQKPKDVFKWRISDDISQLAQNFQSRVHSRGLLFNICSS